MKMKWYLFFLTILTLSFIFYNFFSFEKEVPFKIGVLMVGEERTAKYRGLQDGLKDLGYEQKDFHFSVKSANDDTATLKKQVKELLNEELDLIITLGGIETVELKKEMEKEDKEIPVVFAGVAAPKELGIIDDYRSPGGSFTGINNYHTSLSGKRLELLHDLVPSVERVLVLFDQDVDVSRLSLQKTIEAAEALSIKIVPFNVSNTNYKGLMEETVQENDALFILPSFRIESITSEIVSFSKKHDIPVMGLYEHEVEAGYLASYGTSFFDQGYHSARFVSSILQGNSPSQIPTELPDTVRFLINKEVVNELKIDIHSELIHIAEFIHEGEDK